MAASKNIVKTTKTIIIMKRTLSLLLMLVLGFGISMARVPKKKFVTQVFKTDIRCHNCEKKIMDNVAVFGKGVQDVKVNLETKEVAITYDAKKTNPETLVKGFEKLKVKATLQNEAVTPEAKKDVPAGQSVCTPCPAERQQMKLMPAKQVGSKR